jgi:hypothetical protein
VGLVIPIKRFRKEKIILNKDSHETITQEIENADKLTKLAPKAPRKLSVLSIASKNNQV